MGAATCGNSGRRVGKVGAVVGAVVGAGSRGRMFFFSCCFDERAKAKSAGASMRLFGSAGRKAPGATCRGGRVGKAKAGRARARLRQLRLSRLGLQAQAVSQA